jgi:replication factor A1
MTETHTTIEAAKMRSGINVAGEITNVSETRTVNLKAGGSVNVADATLTDEVGEIGLTLWGEDIALCPKGTKVAITNGFSNEFKGQVAITKGKFGKLEVHNL